MKRCVYTACAILLVAIVGLSPSTLGQVLAPAQDPTHRFDEMAPGVYFVTGTGRVQTMSNSMVIVGSRDCILVDTHLSPVAARALMHALKSVTEKPIGQLILTHYHFDHAHGNQVFGPGIQIIGHEFTHKMLSGDIWNDRTFKAFTESVPLRIAELKERISNQHDDQEKTQLLANLRAMEQYKESIREFKPTPPNVTLARRLTLFQDEREIQVIFPGRGHTGGDVVVYLPGDRLIFTGDFLLGRTAYMGDAYVDDWPYALEALKTLDFSLILPGHGEPIRSRENIDRFQAYLRDLWAACVKLQAEGVPYEEAAKRIDMRAYREHYGIQQIGVDPRYVRRIYERIEEKRTEP